MTTASRRAVNIMVVVTPGFFYPFHSCLVDFVRQRDESMSVINGGTLFTHNWMGDGWPIEFNINICAVPVVARTRAHRHTCACEKVKGSRIRTVIPSCIVFIANL